MPSTSTGWRCSGPGGVRGVPRSSLSSNAKRWSTSPSVALGLPYAQWSLSRLREQAVQRGLVPSISEEWWCVTRHEDEVSHQSIRTWKTSPDPLFEDKMRQVIQLIRIRHNPPVVSSADKVGPIHLIPHGGQGWFPKQRLGRIPAEHHRKFGTVYDFLALNLFHQWLFGRVYRTEHAANWLEHLKDVRGSILGTSGSILCWDGASNHWKAAIRHWVRANRVRLFSTPTQGNHLNPGERHAGDLQKLAMAGEIYTTPDAVGRALDSAVRYRNDERQVRGKRLCDTVRQDYRRRANRPARLGPR